MRCTIQAAAFDTIGYMYVWPYILKSSPNACSLFNHVNISQMLNLIKFSFRSGANHRSFMAINIGDDKDPDRRPTVRNQTGHEGTLHIRISLLKQ